MKKSVQVAMLLGVITLSMVSCDKDDNQLQIKKEVKANGVDEQEVDHDYGNTPIKRPKNLNVQQNNAYQELEHDYGNTPIKRPTSLNVQQNNTYQELEHDYGNTPIKRPTGK